MRCREDQYRNASTGVCECPSPFVEQPNGSCACEDGTELINGECLTKCPRLRNQATQACCNIERAIQDAAQNHNPTDVVGKDCTCGQQPIKRMDCAGFCGGGSTESGGNCMEGSTTAHTALRTASESGVSELKNAEKDFISKCNRVNFVSDCYYVTQKSKCNRSWSSTGALMWKRVDTQPDMNIYTEIQLPKFKIWLYEKNYPLTYDHNFEPYDHRNMRAWRLGKYNEDIFDVEKELKSFDAMHPKTFIKVNSDDGVEYYYIKNTDSANEYTTFNVCQWRNGEGCTENAIRPYSSRCDGMKPERRCFNSCETLCGGICPSYATDDTFLQATLDLPKFSILTVLFVMIALGAMLYFRRSVFV